MRNLKATTVITLASALFATSPPPTNATGPTVRVSSIPSTSCVSGGATSFTMELQLDGTDNADVLHTLVRSGGIVYENQQRTSNGTGSSTIRLPLRDDFTYGDATPRGTWPLPKQQPLRVELSLERPKGTVMNSWTLSVDSCNQGKVLYSGPTADDQDEDNVPVPTDRCPTIEGLGFKNGCPLYDRALTLAYEKHPTRFVGRLGTTDPGRELRSNMPVTVWRVRSGTDQQIGKDVTSTDGTYAVAEHAEPGSYYATTPGTLVPTVGAVLEETSQKVSVPQESDPIG